MDIVDLLDKNERDPALKVIFQLISICFFLLIRALQVFLPQLIDHLFAQLLGMVQAGVKHEFKDEERMSLTIDNNCLYQHQVLSVNYTTYDNRRIQDDQSPYMAGYHDALWGE
jgi:hypothetical protein